jgi:hypothetical protein
MFVARFGAFVLATTFAWASLVKIGRFSAWRDALSAYRLPEWARTGALALVPAVEATIAALFVVRATRVAAVASVVLLTGFSIFLYREARRRGARLPCGCFGRTRERDVRVSLARNAALVALAAWLLGRGSELSPWPPAPQGDEWIAAALTLAAAALATWAATTFTTAAARGRLR